MYYVELLNDIVIHVDLLLYMFSVPCLILSGECFKYFHH